MVPVTFDELIALLKTSENAEAIDIRREEIAQIIPSVRRMFDYDQQNYAHCYDLWMHCLHTVVGIHKDVDDAMLYLAALLHDIGKTCLPLEILNKPETLTEDEYEEVKRHPRYGYNMLKNNEEISSVTRNAIFSHHENEDGSGYPRNLTSDKIHKFAKIIHIADVYDALITKRVYKEAINPADAME